jgi:hypothetical protein
VADPHRFQANVAPYIPPFSVVAQTKANGKPNARAPVTPPVRARNLHSSFRIVTGVRGSLSDNANSINIYDLLGRFLFANLVLRW